MTPNQDSRAPTPAGPQPKDITSTSTSAGTNTGRPTPSADSDPARPSPKQPGSSKSHEMRPGNTEAVDRLEESGLRLTSRSGMQSGWSDIASRSETDFDASKVNDLIQEAMPNIIAEVESRMKSRSLSDDTALGTSQSEQSLRSYINAEIQKAQAIQARSLGRLIQDEVAKAVQLGLKMDKVREELNTPGHQVSPSQGSSGLLWTGNDAFRNNLDEARRQVSLLTKKNNGFQESVKEKAKSIRDLRKQVNDLQFTLGVSARTDSLDDGRDINNNNKESDLTSENHMLTQRVRELEEKLRDGSQMQLDVLTLESFRAATADLSRKVDGITIDSERVRHWEQKLDKVTQERDETRARMASLMDQIQVMTETQSQTEVSRKRPRRDSSNLSHDMLVFGNACKVLASNLQQVKVRFLEPSDGSAPRGQI